MWRDKPTYLTCSRLPMMHGTAASLTNDGLCSVAVDAVRPQLADINTHCSKLAYHA